MLKPHWLIPLFFISIGARNSFAFDPFSAISGAQSLGNFMSGSGIDGALDLGDALADLMKEAEVDESLIREMDNNVKRLEELNSKVRELGHVSGEVQSLFVFDLARSKSLASKLRNITGKIRQGKRVYSLLKGLGGKQGAAAIQIEQVRLNYRVLDELRNIRLTQFNQYLEERERRANLQAGLEKTLEEEKSYRAARLSEFESKKGSL